MGCNQSNMSSVAVLPVKERLREQYCRQTSELRASFALHRNCSVDVCADGCDVILAFCSSGRAAAAQLQREFQNLGWTCWSPLCGKQLQDGSLTNRSTDQDVHSPPEILPCPSGVGADLLAPCIYKQVVSSKQGVVVIVSAGSTWDDVVIATLRALVKCRGKKPYAIVHAFDSCPLPKNSDWPSEVRCLFRHHAPAAAEGLMKQHVLTPTKSKGMATVALSSNSHPSHRQSVQVITFLPQYCEYDVQRIIATLAQQMQQAQPTSTNASTTSTSATSTPLRALGAAAATAGSAALASPPQQQHPSSRKPLGLICISPQAVAASCMPPSAVHPEPQATSATAAANVGGGCAGTGVQQEQRPVGSTSSASSAIGQQQQQQGKAAPKAPRDSISSSHTSGSSSMTPSSTSSRDAGAGSSGNSSSSVGGSSDLAAAAALDRQWHAASATAAAAGCATSALYAMFSYSSPSWVLPVLSMCSQLQSYGSLWVVSHCPPAAPSAATPPPRPSRPSPLLLLKHQVSADEDGTASIDAPATALPSASVATTTSRSNVQEYYAASDAGTPTSLATLRIDVFGSSTPSSPSTAAAAAARCSPADADLSATAGAPAAAGARSPSGSAVAAVGGWCSEPAAVAVSAFPLRMSRLNPLVDADARPNLIPSSVEQTSLHPSSPRANANPSPSPRTPRAVSVAGPGPGTEDMRQVGSSRDQVSQQRITQQRTHQVGGSSSSCAEDAAASEFAKLPGVKFLQLGPTATAAIEMAEAVGSDGSSTITDAGIHPPPPSTAATLGRSSSSTIRPSSAAACQPSSHSSPAASAATAACRPATAGVPTAWSPAAAAPATPPTPSQLRHPPPHAHVAEAHAAGATHYVLCLPPRTPLGALGGHHHPQAATPQAPPPPPPHPQQQQPGPHLPGLPPPATSPIIAELEACLRLGLQVVPVVEARYEATAAATAVATASCSRPCMGEDCWEVWLGEASGEVRQAMSSAWSRRLVYHAEHLQPFLALLCDRLAAPSSRREGAAPRV